MYTRSGGVPESVPRVGPVATAKLIVSPSASEPDRVIDFAVSSITPTLCGFARGGSFTGVTFVEMERNITNSSGVTTYNKDEARSWSQRMKTGSFSPDTALTQANSYGFEKGNNLRFHNTTFEGPIAGNYATAYSHFTNSWEFTGATMFDNKWIDPISPIVFAAEWSYTPEVQAEERSTTDEDAGMDFKARP